MRPWSRYRRALFGCLAILASGLSGIAAPWNVVALSGNSAPGSPFPFASFDQPSINARGDVAFIGSIKTDIPTTCGRGGPTTDCTVIRSGAWLEHRADSLLTSVVIGNDNLPSGPSPVEIVKSILLNNVGDAAVHVAFSTGNGIYQSTNTGLRSVAVPGQPLGIGSLVFGNNISTPYLNDLGQTLFSAPTVDSVSQATNSAYWVSNTAGIAQGPPMTDYRFGFSANGHLAFNRIVPGQAFDYGLYLGDLQTQQLALRQGTPAVGTSSLFQYPQTPRVNDDGEFVAHITIGPNSSTAAGVGIWTGTAATLAPVVLSGDDAPGTTAKFQEFNYYPNINNSGDVALIANLEGAGITSGNRQGLWKGLPGDLHKIMQQGDPAPGTDAQFGILGIPSFDGYVFPSIESIPFAFNNNGQLCFLAQLVGNNVTTANDNSLWGQTTDGTLKLLLREGDFIQLQPGDERQVTRFQMRFGYGTGLSDNGEVAIQVSFTDGSQAILVTDQLVSAVPEVPSAPLLLLGSLLATLFRSARPSALTR